MDKGILTVIICIGLYLFSLYSWYFHHQTNRRLEILERKEEQLYKFYKELDWKYEYST